MVFVVVCSIVTKLDSLFPGGYISLPSADKNNPYSLYLPHVHVLSLTTYGCYGDEDMHASIFIIFEMTILVLCAWSIRVVQNLRIPTNRSIGMLDREMTILVIRGNLF